MKEKFYLKDYKPPVFWQNKIDLNFDLYETHTLVTAESQINFNGEAHGAFAKGTHELLLDGEKMELESVQVNGENWSDYEKSESALTLKNVPENFSLRVVTRIDPAANKSGEGLYLSKGLYTTQCESQGFRRMTYFVDRPDNMALFTTRITADKARYPELLSNGNLVESGELSSDESGDESGDENGKGRHFAKWEDPFRKPAYLFALVAGDLEGIDDTFTTRSGREVKLRVLAGRGRKERCQHAMESLKWSMKWDEERFNREYDLDLFMIVAVDDFNFGAMENKGLNIYNSLAALADAKTADDRTHFRITSIIGHEYFHNWSGNRVTCRDWFQLSLKEGLTVYRDQEFTADLFSRSYQRIEDVKALRTAQFSEDAGPTAHPVRPESAYSVDNFYTPTIYEKGAELIRMMETILGREAFAKAVDKYFEMYDGQAVTTDDFVHALEVSSGADLTHFRKWYSQAGTPKVKARIEQDLDSGLVRLHLSQRTDPTPDQPVKGPLHIPVKLGLIGRDSKKDLLPTEHVVHLQKAEETFEFKGITEAVVPSLFRDFSAPVELEYEGAADERLFLMKHDSNLFNRWEAFQTMQIEAVSTLYLAKSEGKSAAGEAADLVPSDLAPNDLWEGLRENLKLAERDPLFVSLMLGTPDWGSFERRFKELNPAALGNALTSFKEQKAKALAGELEKIFENYRLREGDTYELSPEKMGQRLLAESALHLLVRTGEEKFVSAAKELFTMPMMAAQWTAVTSMAHLDHPASEEILNKAWQDMKADGVQINKAITAYAAGSGTRFEEVYEKITKDPDFDAKNANNVRSLWRGFARENTANFHSSDGRYYKMLADATLEADSFNAHLSSGMVMPLLSFKNYAPKNADKMRSELERIFEQKNISANLYELVEKALQ